ncbi:hypothetical protein GCM10010193_56950 [Kitasatospora atroaurantiaca]|uniref:Uncharacterized protein n=1 Tax=Kitasatospora atroaurantiaca TaxID=285545 RepID=A0A561EMV5_9ACTN|nr:hypothetical protein [Kitasatospora atroaurantiaca]TWE16944.1 hypothetical protein FB465_1939 [Kitasatospora atroaurantiaca]
MIDRISAVQRLAEQLDLPAEAVAIGYRMVREALKAHRQHHHPSLSVEAYLRLAFADGYAVNLIAAASFRLLRRDTDAEIVEAIHRAAHPKPGAPHVAPSAGCAPQDANYLEVRTAIAILTAAGLPAIEAPRAGGFQVVPAGPELPRWVFIARDQEHAARTGFAGGADGYERVLRFAGWFTRPEPDTGLLGACPPEHIQAALDARNEDQHRPA